MAPRRTLSFVMLGLVVFGAAALGIGALSSLAPTSTVVAPYIDVQLKDIEPGSFIVVEVGDHPYAVVRTSPEMIGDLKALTEQTWSRRQLSEQVPEYFVVSFVSTNLGCLLAHAPKGKPKHHPEVPWFGGFYDTCHSGEWDYSGRALLRSPKFPDLPVPDYTEPASGTVRTWRMTANPSIERTAYGMLRMPPTAAHVER